MYAIGESDESDIQWQFQQAATILLNSTPFIAAALFHGFPTNSIGKNISSDASEIVITTS